MKRLSHPLMCVLGLAVIVGEASAQSGPRFEIGAFGSFTKYDQALGLGERAGGGARIAFHFNRFLGLELDGAYLGPSSLAGGPSNGLHLGSASILLGGGSNRFSVFALGGYTRFDIGSTAPYDYATNAFHGGAGFRIGLTDHIAIRADGRAVLASDDPLTGGTATHVIGTIGLSFLSGGGRAKPADGEEPAQPQPVRPPREVTPPAPITPGQAQQAEPEPQPEAEPEPTPMPAATPAPVAPHAEAAPRSVARRGDWARAEQIELSSFVSFTRYDETYLLGNQIGGGVRLGYFLSDRINIEFEGGYQAPELSSGVDASSLALGSASLGLNFPLGHHSVYLLGGFTRLRWGEFPPYEFDDNAVHGAVGARLFLSPRIALRLEGRAIYVPETNSGTADWAGHVTGSAGLSFFAAPPRQRVAGGVGGRSYQWYWGGHGGAFVYKTNTQPYYYDPLVGGHWLVTAKRTSLYFAYEQAFFLTQATALVFDPSAASTGSVREVAFDDMRRIMFGLLAHPAQKVIEPFGGLGFAMVQVLNPTPDCTFDCETLSKAAEATERAERAASKAFFWVMVGLQMNYSNRLNVFGHYILTSSSRDFLLSSNTHTIQGGIRYAFGPAKESVTTR